MLSPDQIKAREGMLTGSRIGVLMSGDKLKIMNLWRELVGDPGFVDEDLSDVWPVQLGSFTEPLNLDWFERRHGGPVSRRGEVVVHANGWLACTLDGFHCLRNRPVECKHTGGFENLGVLVDRYLPQMTAQMIVTGTTECAFSVIMGAREPVVEIVPLDEVYAAELMRRAEAFMRCVWSLTPPIAMEPVAPPVKAEKTYDMQGNNAWGANAATWLSTRQAKKDYDTAEKELKATVPADAVRCFGYGVEAKRNRAGSLSLKEMAS